MCMLNIDERIVFDVGGHTGDMLLALPVVQGLKEQGMEVRVRVPPSYYKPASCFGVRNQPHYTGKAVKLLSGDKRHRTEAWLAAAKRHGLKAAPTRPKANIVPNKELLPGEDWVLLQPWCEWRRKHWPLSNWITLADELNKLGHKVAVGGPKVFEKKANAIPAVNLCGKDGSNWPATIAAASLVISVDSGAVHMADALGIKHISMYSDVMPVSVWAPYWDRSGIIAKPRMQDIKVEDVLCLV